MCCLEVAGNLWLSVYMRAYKVLITQQCLIATYGLVQFFSQKRGRNASWQSTTKYVGENCRYFRCSGSQ